MNMTLAGLAAARYACSDTKSTPLPVGDTDHLVNSYFILPLVRCGARIGLPGPRFYADLEHILNDMDDSA